MELPKQPGANLWELHRTNGLMSHITKLLDTSDWEDLACEMSPLNTPLITGVNDWEKQDWKRKARFVDNISEKYTKSFWPVQNVDAYSFQSLALLVTHVVYNDNTAWFHSLLQSMQQCVLVNECTYSAS